MNSVKVIIDVCVSILTYKINLLGYSISLSNVMVYTMLGMLLLYFLFRIFR